MFKPEATTAQYFDWTWDREHGRIVERNFPVKLREGMRVEFRAEASTLGNPQFGSISSTARANRQFQFGLKLLF